MPVSGVLAAALDASARALGLICPQDQGGEAAWAEGTEILAPPTLMSLINHFKGSQVLSAPEPALKSRGRRRTRSKGYQGQDSAKRALEVTAAGGHNLLMVGPPGAGKSMLAQRLPGILPPLEPSEALEVSLIHSVAGTLEGGRLIRDRPFRDPHHSASLPALAGGGSRQNRARSPWRTWEFSSWTNCPNSAARAWRLCASPWKPGASPSPGQRPRHLSGARAIGCRHEPLPLRLFRRPRRGLQPCAALRRGLSGQNIGSASMTVSTYTWMCRGENAGSQPSAPGEGSAEVAQRVARARRIQQERFSRVPGEKRPRCNAEVDGKLLEEVATPDSEGQALLLQAAERLRLTGRGYHRVLRVARSLADLEESAEIRRPHIAEALSYRRLPPGREL